MNNVKPYLKFLSVRGSQFALFYLLFSFMNMLFSVIGVNTSFTSSDLVNGQYIYTSILMTQGVFICAFCGVMNSLVYFNGAMSIRADRKSYIKASIIMTIIMSVYICLLSAVTDFVSGEILSVLLDVDVVVKGKLDITSSVLKINVAEVNLDFNLIMSILIAIMYSSIGYLIGSLLYRLKMKSKVGLFIGLPVLSFTALYARYKNDVEGLDNMINTTIEVFISLVSNTPLLTATIIMVSIISLSLSVLLLRKAPIKEYASDLLI